MTAGRIFLDLFIFGLGAYVMAGLRELRRDSERDRHPDVPYDEPERPTCPQCGAPYLVWSHVPAIVGMRGEILQPKADKLTCREGHQWGAGW